MLLVAAGAYEAGRRSLVPQQQTKLLSPTVRAAEIELGRTQVGIAQVRFPVVEFYRPGEAGVVTALNSPTVEDGGVLFFRNLRAVVFVVLSVPLFRPLALGVEGPDVAAFQEFLVGAGYLDAAAADGKYGTVTQKAVKRWQETTGSIVDGAVQISDVATLTERPTRLDYKGTVRIGDTLDASVPMLSASFANPEIFLSVAEGQRSVPPTGTAVVVVSPSGARKQFTVGRLLGQAPNQSLQLESADSNGQLCAWLDCPTIVGKTAITMAAEVVLQPPMRGLGLPASSIRYDSSSQPFVRLVSGEDVPIRVITADQGMAIVEGIAPQAEVVLPPVGGAT